MTLTQNAKIDQIIETAKGIAGRAVIEGVSTKKFAVLHEANYDKDFFNLIIAILSAKYAEIATQRAIKDLITSRGY